MNTNKIRETLKSYLAKYKEKSATIGGLEVVFNYSKYIQQEPYIQNLLQEFSTKVDEISSVFEKKINNVKGLSGRQIDIANFKFPAFQKEINAEIRTYKSNRPINRVLSLPMAIFHILIIESVISEFKDRAAKGEITNQAKKDIAELNELAFRIKMPDRRIFTATYSEMISLYLFIINNHIINRLDLDDIINSHAKKKEPWYDDEAHILYVRGKEIKVVKRKGRQYQHHILKKLMNNEDLSSEVDYVDMADQLGIIDYNGPRDWQKIRHACDEINRKVKEETKIPDKFILTHSSPRGWCKINPLYI